MTFASGTGESERKVLDRLLEGERLQLHVAGLLGRYRHAVNRLGQLEVDDLNELVEKLLPEDDEDLTDLRELFNELLPDSSTREELLQNAVNSLTQMDIPQDPGFVRVMSLHKSKGLTSPTVYVAGLMDGIVPTVRDRLKEQERQAAVDEQRRLLYVAITRSLSQLVLSSSIAISLPVAYGMGVKVDKATIRKRGDGLWAKAIASPYLAELGADAPNPVRGLQWLQDR